MKYYVYSPLLTALARRVDTWFYLELTLSPFDPVGWGPSGLRRPAFMAIPTLKTSVLRLQKSLVNLKRQRSLGDSLEKGFLICASI